VLENWRGDFSHKKVYYNYRMKMLKGRAKPIRIMDDPDYQLPD